MISLVSRRTLGHRALLRDVVFMDLLGRRVVKDLLVMWVVLRYAVKVR